MKEDRISNNSKPPGIAPAENGSPSITGSDSSEWETAWKQDVLSSDPPRSVEPGASPANMVIPDFQEGEVVNGRYAVVKKLGQGAMGKVYLAKDKARDDTPIALKTIMTENVGQDRVDLFKAEFETLTSLRYAGVIQVFDFESLNRSENFFFTMEYVDGKDIFDHTVGADWLDVLELVVQVCRALSFLHSRNIVHFDIKPRNLLVDRKGNVKVLDFGLAGLRKSADNDAVFGTPLYMAPESFRREPADHRRDIYSLGVVFYQLLSREAPFSCDSWVEIVRWHEVGELNFTGPAWSKVPAWIIEVIRNFCRKNPDDRYPSAHAAIEDINRKGSMSFEFETYSTRFGYVYSSRMIGRDREIAELRQEIQAQLKDPQARPRVLFLEGPSGIGKSRVTRELRYGFQLDRTAFLEGNCYESIYEEFAPICELTRLAIGIGVKFGQSRLLDKYKDDFNTLIPDRVAGGWEKESSNPDHYEGKRRKLIGNIAHFMIELSRQSPIVLHVNDLQWATDAVKDFFLVLVRELERRRAKGGVFRLALLGSYRNDEIEGTSVQRLSYALQGFDAMKVVVLEPLSIDQCGAMIASMLGTDGAPEKLLKKIHADTEGNPYFIEEVVRGLIDASMISIVDGKWRVEENVYIDNLPQTITSAVLRRAALLPSREANLLRVLSVAVKAVQPGILREATGYSTKEVLEGLVVLEKRQMVAPLEGKEVAFRITHDKIRESLIREASPQNLKALHRSLAEAYLRFHDDSRSYSKELAYHYWQAGEDSSALRYALEAAEEARSLYENDTVIELMSIAEKIVEKQSGDKEENFAVRNRLWEELGDAMVLKGRFSEAQDYYARRLEAASTKLDKSRITRKIGHIHYQRGELARAADYFWRSIGLLGGKQPRTLLGTIVGTLLGMIRYRRFGTKDRKGKIGPEERSVQLELASVYFRLGHTYFWSNPNNMALVLLRAGDAARYLSGSEITAAIYAMLAIIFETIKLPKWSDECMKKTGELVEQGQSPFAKAVWNAYCGHICYFRAEWDRAIEYFRKGKKGFYRCGDPAELALANVGLFYSLYFRGHLPEALDCADELLDVLQQAGANQFGKSHYYLRARALSKLGDHEKAILSANAALNLSRQSEDLTCTCKSLLELGDCLLTKGDLDDAIAYLENAKAVREKNHLMLDHVFRLYPLLAWAYIEKIRSDSDRSNPKKHALWKKSGRAITKALKLTRNRRNYRSLALLCRAMRLSMAKDISSATRAFDEALEFSTGLGARIDKGLILMEKGRALIETDKAEAEKCLMEAKNIMEDCGAAVYVPAIAGLLARLAP